MKSSGLQRTLGGFELVMMGVGVIIGSGLFVITGVAAAEHAGPGLVISFILAGAACGCAALCYAELASFLPVSGGGYSFVRIGMGNKAGWFIGWCLTLEYVIGMSAIAVGWSAYISSVLPAVSLDLPQEFLTDPLSGGIVNLPAAAIIMIMAMVQIKGSKESTRLNNILVFVKIAVILIFVIIASGKIDTANYDPFLPFGWSGVFSGAAVVFFAYLGFDAIANSAEEVKDPQKNMPVGILGSLAIVTVLYVAVTLVLTGVTKYYNYEGQAAPVAFALQKIGVEWGSVLISAGAIAGLTTGVLVFIGSQSRLLYSMARDGMIPAGFAEISRKGVPVKAVICVALVGSLAAGFLPINMIAQLCNMGTIWAFSAVAFTVILMRRKQPDLKRGFSVPLVPVIPLSAVAMCVILALQLDDTTWIVFAAWTVLGAVIFKVRN